MKCLWKLILDLGEQARSGLRGIAITLWQLG